MNIIRFVKNIILSKLDDNGKDFEISSDIMDFQSFERLLRDKLNEVGRKILKMV